MQTASGQTGGYVLCTILGLLLAVLGLFFVGLLGLVGVTLAVAVTAGCVALSRSARRRGV